MQQRRLLLPAITSVGDVAHSVRTGLLLAATVATMGCGGDNDGPSRPGPPQPTPTTISQSAKGYLDALLGIMEAHSINKATIDWADFRTEVLAAAGTAQSIPDTYPALGVALRLLDDHESYYLSRDAATVIGLAPVGGCAAVPPSTPSLPDSIGYVKVGPCDCDGSGAAEFAESIQQAIRAADSTGLIGWIVDLRGNFGGNMWPMIAGIGPVLGEGIVGWIVYNDREYEREYRAGAALSLGEAFARVETPYALLRENPRVAVLTDGKVSSSGEAIAVFFRGRPDTRSFGTPTCGHHHLQQIFVLADGASLGLVTSQHADRLKIRYGGPIAPDEIVTDPDEAVNRAIAWLQGGG
jgi:hypothetical protein